MRYQTTTPVANNTLPVTVAEVRDHLNIAHTDEDVYLTTLIKAAWAECEKIGRIAILPRSMRVTHVATKDKAQFYLPKGPTAFSLAKLTGGRNGDNTPDLTVTAEMGLNLATRSVEWREGPNSRMYLYANMVIEYTAGVTVEEMADGGDKADIKQAIKDTVAAWFTNRGFVNNGVPAGAFNTMKQYWFSPTYVQ